MVRALVESAAAAGGGSDDDDNDDDDARRALVEATMLDGRTPAHVAARFGQVEALRLLLSPEVGAAKEAQTQDGQTSMHVAVRKGHAEVVVALSELGVSLDPDGDQGARLLQCAGEWCQGDDAAEKKAAVVAALERLCGVGGAAA